MLSTMSVLSAAPPIPTVVSVVGVMATVSPTYADPMETGSPGSPGGAETTADAAVWSGLPPGLLRMRRLLLVVWLGLVAIGVGLLLGLIVGPAWAAFALLPLAGVAWAGSCSAATGAPGGTPSALTTC